MASRSSSPGRSQGGGFELFVMVSLLVFGMGFYGGVRVLQHIARSGPASLQHTLGIEGNWTNQPIPPPVMAAVRFSESVKHAPVPKSSRSVRWPEPAAEDEKTLRPIPAPAPFAKLFPTQTRATRLPAAAYGMGKLMHLADYMRDYIGSRTEIESYVHLDTDEVDGLVGTIRAHARIQAESGREFWPQIALETRHLDLPAFYKALSQPGSPVNRRVRRLAHEISLYPGRWYFIRPFSEMNDATPATPWEMGLRDRHNGPQEFAAAWKLLRDVFNKEGAVNTIFVFSPLAAHGVGREELVLAALNAIPKGYIDAFGMNVYSRPLTAYHGKSSRLLTFAELTQPWRNVLARSKQRGIPYAVPEMGVSNQASDEQRAQWLRDAFDFARSHGFVLMTYFNFPHRYWQIDEGTRAGEVLRAEIERL